MLREEKLAEIIARLPRSYSIYGNLFAVSNKLQAVGDRQLEDLTMRQEYLLICLALFEDYAPTLQELANVFGSSYQNVKRMSSQLEKLGYLRIEEDSLDKRKIRIVLNQEKYSKMRAAKKPQDKAFMEALFAGLNEQGQIILEDALNLMRHNLDQMD